MPAATAAVLGVLVCILVACAACGRRSGGAAPGKDAGSTTNTPARVEIDVFALGRVLGTVAPCGCTTEPLGGLQYLFGFIEGSSRAEARLVVGPGSFLFPDPDGPEAPGDEGAWAQAARRAEVLRNRFAQLGGALALGLGPMDRTAPQGSPANDAGGPPLPRMLANAPKQAGAAAGHRIAELDVGGRALKVGITAAVDPAIAHAQTLGALTPPLPAIRAEVAAMREAGAELTIAVIEGPRTLAETVAREVGGLDLAVVGRVEGVERARLGAPVTRVGDTFVLEPGEQLQTVTHLRLSIDASLRALPAAATWTLASSQTDLERELRRVEERLAKFRADPDADAAFIAKLESERARLQAARSGNDGDSAPVRATFEQAKITCKRAADPGAESQLDAYDAWVAQQNRERFAGVRPPAPSKGAASYVGIETCKDCHEEAVTMWHDTVHARAFQTLVDANKQFDLSCVGCHVTGFRKPGGSEVVENAGLRDVQCEVCHGPGSKHVDSEDEADIRRDAPSEVCLECHTPEHSDTFDYEAYLRDVLGPDHGDDARKALGDGPTGAQLRKAGLEKAGGACKKM